MTDFQHPIRNQGVRVWAPHSNTDRWIAMFTNGKTWPIWFQGENEGEAVEKLEAFRTKTVEENEARSIASQKAREDRARKQAEKKAKA